MELDRELVLALVLERNAPDDTFGFGVVFSDETLGFLNDYDPPSYEAIRRSFSYWDDVEIHYKNEVLRCAGNGFCGCSRLKLLELLQERAAGLGVESSRTGVRRRGSPERQIAGREQSDPRSIERLRGSRRGASHRDGAAGRGTRGGGGLGRGLLLLAITLYLAVVVGFVLSLGPHWGGDPDVVGTLRGLSRALDAKDTYTRGHSDRVAYVAAQLASAAGPTESWEEEAHARVLIDGFKKTVPPDWLGVFELRFLQQLPQREAARRLAMHRTTLAYREIRIRRLLRRHFLSGRKP